MVADILEREGREVADGIAAAGGTARFQRLDVTQEADWQAAVEAALAAFGRLDILVNNAGISGSAAEDMFDTELWHRIMAVNATGVFFGVKYAIPAMTRTGGGAIVNMSSISGGGGNRKIHPAYNASKGAVRLLTKSVALSGARKTPKVRCNSIHPAFVEGDMVDGIAAVTRDPIRSKERMSLDIPLGRMARPVEIAVDPTSSLIYVAGGGTSLHQVLRCASDSYKFELSSNVVANSGKLSGTWSEATRNINGEVQGTTSGGRFQVVVSAGNFTADLVLTTRGNSQSVVIRSEGTEFRQATINLVRV